MSSSATSTATPAPPMPPDVRQARVATSVLFLTNGAVFANLIPRYPEIKADLGLSNAVYGLAVAAFPAGAFVLGLAAGGLIRRFGSARVAVWCTLLVSVGVLLAGLAPSVGVLALLLFLAGATDTFTDVAQNAQGLIVQRRMGRSIINSFHAFWSIGAVLGGAMAAGAIALDVPRGIHFAITGALFSAIAFGAQRFFLPDAAPAPEATETGHAYTDNESASHASAPGMSRIRLLLTMAALVVIAMSNSFVEDAGNSWAALYLAESLGAAPAIAAAGFIALVGAQFVGRITGDRFVDRFGQRAVARTGGLLLAVGMGLALAFPTVPGSIAGFAAAGLGIATLVPATMHAADELPGLRPGTGLTVVTWLMRIGFLASPPVIGLVSDATSLRTALLALPIAGIVVVLLSGVLAGRRGASAPAPS